MLQSSPVPLYFQLANQLEARITSGEYPVNSFLPSEHQLAAEFDVSLITVRGAMRLLIDKGLVERRPGKGTAVVEKSARTVWELGWLSELVTSVMASELKVIAMGQADIPDWVAQKLDLDGVSSVHHMRTIRVASRRNAEPYMMTDLYYPPDIGRELSKKKFQSAVARSKLAILTVEEACGLSVSGVRQTMTAETADKDAAKLLQVDIGHPVLVVIRDYVDEDGRVVQTGKSRYRTDHYEYVLNVSKNTSRPSRGGRRLHKLGMENA